jgi:hypothetical protein
MATLAPTESRDSGYSVQKRAPSATRAGRSASAERFASLADRMGRALSPGRAPAPRGLMGELSRFPLR